MAIENSSAQGVCARMVQARHSFVMTQAQVADAIGYSQSTLAGIESGRDNPSRRFLAAWARFFAINRQWLLTGEGSMLTASETADEDALPQGWILARADAARLRAKARSLLQDAQNCEAQANLSLSGVGLDAEVAAAMQPGQTCRVDSRNEVLTSDAKSPTNSPVQPIMPTLIERLRRATSERGRKTELAAWLGVPRQSVNDWLSARMEPSGETTLRLLNWVTADEAQSKTKSPASASTPAGPQTQVTKRNENESNSGPP